MFDIGWSEMFIILLVAVLVIGPRDLPKMARTVGRWVGRARAMARDFQRSIDDMIREAELDEIKRQVDRMGTTDLAGELNKAVDPKGELKKALDLSDIDAPKTSSPAPAPEKESKPAASGPGEGRKPEVAPTDKG